MGVCTITYLTTIYSASRAHHQGESRLAFAGLAFLGGEGGERYLTCTNRPASLATPHTAR